MLELNNRILRGLNARWHHPGPFLAADATLTETSQQVIAETTRQYLHDAAGTLRASYSAAPCIALKEPRICFLWPLWDQALRTCGYSTHYILIFRNPLEVAMSLEKRDGLELPKGIRLWLQCNLDALEVHFSKGIIEVIPYEDLLEHPEETMRSLLHAIGDKRVSDPASFAQLVTFLKSERRHHVISTGEFHRSPSISELAKEVYQSLSEWRHLAQQEQLRRIRQWRVRFDDFCMDERLYIPYTTKLVSGLSATQSPEPKRSSDSKHQAESGSIRRHRIKNRDRTERRRARTNQEHSAAEPGTIEVHRRGRLARKALASAKHRGQLSSKGGDADVTTQGVPNTQIDRLTFYNAPSNLIQAPVVEHAPMDVEIISNAVVARPTAVITHTRRLIRGAIYNPEGALLPGRVQNGPGSKSNAVPDTLPSERIASAERLSGSYVYLEMFRPPFGHVLLETLSRAWYLTKLQKDIRIILHGGPRRDSGELPSYIRAMLDILSIEHERVVIADRDLHVQNLIIPSPLFWLKTKGSYEFCSIFDHMRTKLARSNYLSTPDLPKKLYLTRRKYDSMLLEKQRVKEKLSGKMTRKLVVNEADAESLFASRGFQIVAPETLPFEAQIMLIGNASHVAGLAGSALHMILFNGQPETKLIELSSRYVRNQIIINALRRVEGHHIFCVNQLDETARPVLDIERIADTLDHIL